MRFTLLLALGLACLTVARGQDPRDGLAQALDPDTPRSRAGLPLDVAGVREDPLLGPDRTPAILPVGDDHPDRDPLLIVHGIKADFGDVAPLVRHLGAQTRYQVHVVAYADVKRRTSKNGDDLARLLVERFRGRPLTFVAHSMGGIVVRRALNRLAVSGHLRCFPRVRVLTVDTPWHGYEGPRDGFRMSFARPFMPDGYEDMRARSPMFAGDDRARDALDRVGLYGVDLPASVEVHMVAAQQGDQALDYTELTAVPGQLARRLDLEPFDEGTDIRVRHAVAALVQSEVGRSITRRQVPLTPRCVRDALERLVPRLPGDHSTVLRSEAFFARVERFLGL